MSNYQGEITGIGVSSTRKNEITAESFAEFRNFAVGHEYGVVQSQNHDFHAWVDGGDINGTPNNLNVEYSNIVHISDGMFFAYGYFGYVPAATITFLPPAVEQYHIIFGEINLSVIPNTCKIKTKNNYSSPQISKYSFRQDVLSTVKTGVFQIPLWIIKVTNKGIRIEPLSPQFDKRKLVPKIKQVANTENTQRVIETVANTAKCTTQPQSANDKKLASRQFAQSQVQTAINE